MRSPSATSPAFAAGPTHDSADWSCTDTYPLELYLVDGIDGSTTWNNAPGETDLGESRSVGGSGSANCYANVPFEYDITATMAKAASHGWTHTAFGVHGPEGNDMGFKHLSRGASITVEYDRTPTTPTDPITTPEAQDASSGTKQPCDGTANPTTEAFVGSRGGAGLDLKASFSSPAQSQVRGYFSLWDDSVSGFPTVASGYTGYSSSGTQIAFHVDAGKLTDGHAYAWDTATSDGLLSSGYSSTCHIRVDLTPPTFSFGASTDFPPSGSGQAAAKFSGQSGTFPFSANDAAPSSGPASGLACVRFGWDSTLSDDAWQCGASLPSASLAATPPHWGTNILYAQAEDRAGNLSQVASYGFYAPQNPLGPPPVFGDTTGDGVPDIVTPGSDGNLYAHSIRPGSQTSIGVRSLAARTGNTRGGDSWANYQISHRGSLSGGKNIDDLLVHKPGDANLYDYPNPGNTGVDGVFDHYTAVAKPACQDDGSGTYCNGYASDWTTALAIASIGDPGTSSLDAGKFSDRAGMITEESNPQGDAALWFYPGVGDKVLGHPIRLAATGWKGWDLISAGDWAAQGRPGLWARNRASGVINAYTFATGTRNTDDNGIPVTEIINGMTVIAPAPTLTSISAPTQIGAGITAAAYPLVGSEGDLTGDGVPDFWATTTGDAIQVWPGVTSDGTAKTAVSTFAPATVVGWTTDS